MAEQVSSLKTGIKYKDTPIGRIPVDWELVKLGTVSNLKNGINFKKEQKGDAGILTVDVLNMYSIDIFVDPTNLYRVNIDLDSKEEYILKRGDILFVRSSLKKEGVGWASLFKPFNEPATFCGFIIRGRLISTKIVPEFLIYFLRSYGVRERLISGAGQVAITNISQETLQDLEIVVPPSPEQKKIAEILTTVDEAIQKTDQIIEKIKDVKKGLMQKLLTRGIGHKKFKKSEIGEIPEEWQIEKIADIAKGNKGSIKIGPFGSQLKKSEMVDSGIRVYGQENVYRKNFILGEYFITHEKFKKLKTVELLPGDVVITMMGTIGDCAVVPEDIQKGIMDSHLMRIQIKGIINPYYLARLIRESLLVKKQIIGMSQGGIMSGLNLSIVKEIKIPVPPMEEQDEIEKIMAGLDIKIKNEQTYRSELKEIKKGLMQVLLTGKIRVSA